MIELTIKTLDSKNHKFSVEDKCTVAELKEKIEQCLGMPINRQKLIFMGKVLTNDMKLWNLGVNGKVTHLVEISEPDSEQNSTLPRMASTSTSPRPIPRAESSTNTDTSSPDNAGQAQATTSHIRMRRQMLSAPSQSSHSVGPQIYLPTAGRVEIIRRITVDIRSSINQLETLQRELAQMRGFHHSESDDEDSMGWFYNRDNSRERGRVNTNFNFHDDSELDAFRFSLRRSLGSEIARVTPRELAVLFEELECLNLRFTPFKKRYIHSLFHSNRRNPANYNDEYAMAMQRILDMTSEILHNFSHAYHAISDVNFDITVPIPRLTSEMISPPLNAIPIHRQVNRVHSARSDSETANAPSTSSGANAASGEEAAGTDTTSGAADSFSMDDENLLDEARAVNVPSSFYHPQRRETVGTSFAANDAPIDRNTRQRRRDSQPRNPSFHVEIGTRSQNQANAEQFARLIQVCAEIDNSIRLPGRAVMINRGVLPQAGEGNRDPNVHGTQIGDGVYVFRVAQASSQREAIQNIMTNAIRRTLESATPRSHESNNDEQMNSAQPGGQQNLQGQQIQFMEFQSVPRGIVIDENVYDPFLNCDSVYSSHRLQQRRMGEHSHGDLRMQRRQTEIIAARNLNYIRECGCLLSNEDMAMVEQMLEYPPSPLSWLNAFLVVSARFIFTREIVAIDMSDESVMMPNDFIATLKLLRAYMQHLINVADESMSLTETFENVTNHLLGTIGGFISAVIANPHLVHMQNNIDVILSIRRFIRTRLPDMYSILTSQQPERYLVSRLYMLLGQMYIDMLAFIQCCVVDEFGLRILYTMLIAHLTEVGDSDSTRCLRYFSQAIFNQALTIIHDSHPLISTEVIHFADATRQRRQSYFPQSETNAASISQIWTSANASAMVDVGTSTEPTGTPQTSEASTNTDDDPMTGEESHETAGTSSSSSTNADYALSAPTPFNIYQMPTHASLIAQHWDFEHVPVLTGDQNLQRVEQPPFSDNYLTGMPSRKRRRIKQSRPPTNLDGLIKDDFDEDAVQLGEVNESDRAMIREHIRELVQGRTGADEDFNPAIYANIATFLQPRPSDDDEVEYENN